MASIALLMVSFFIILASGIAMLEFKSINQQVIGQLSFNAASKLERLGLRLSYLVESVEDLASSSLLINSMIDVSGRGFYLPDAIKDFSRSSEISSVIAFDYAGAVVEAGNAEVPAWFRRELVRPTISLSQRTMVFNAARGSLIVVTPVSYYDTPQGGLAVEINIAEVLSDIFLLEDSEYRVTMGESWVFETKAEPDDAISMQEYPKADNILAPFAVTMTAFKGRDFVTRQILSTMYKILILGVLGIVASVLIAYRVANKLSLPILTLANRVKNDVHPCGPIGTEDELELLAESFDTKTEQILKAKSELEVKVVERTRQLEEKTRELEEQKQRLLEMNSELVAANNNLQYLDKLKDEFVSVVSHELRTPLTSVRGTLGLLANNVVDSQVKKAELINTALSNSVRLSKLIDDLLDIQKLSSGKFEINRNVVSVGKILEKEINEALGYAQQYGVTLNYLNKGDENYYVMADEHRIQQVIDNLVSNAIKYSPKGRCVELSAREEQSLIKISVRDHGQGIPDDFRATVFEKFTQADASDRRAKSGTGLGLSICKGIVELHGGNIGYENAEDGGAIFWFTLEKANKAARESSVNG